MGWEEEIPAVPTRQQEKEFIADLEKNYLSQPYNKLYMSEALRRTKMSESYIINKFRLEWFKNFLIGNEKYLRLINIWSSVDFYWKS